MLAKRYRFKLLNATGQTITAASATISRIGWKFDSSGGVVYESSATSVYSNASVNNNNYDAGSAVDNSSSLYVGGIFVFTLTAPTSSNGDVTIYLEVSNDGGTTWQSDGLGMPVCVITATAATTYSKSFAL
jgi:beta-lactam-binding protein with PASTA domain